jgi:3-hydroxyisobutyrate dehydrogenase
MARANEAVAVVGIGTMGHGMATSTLRAGIPTIVWNREPEAPQTSPGSARRWLRRSPPGAPSRDPRCDGDHR